MPLNAADEKFMLGYLTHSYIIKKFVVKYHLLRLIYYKILHGATTMLEDASLIQQTLAGDNQAFHLLMDKYQSAIYRLICFLVQNPDDAQELTQEAFLKAYKELGSLKQPERFGFWINQIARNLYQDWRRKNQVEFSELHENIIADTQHIDESLIFQETLAKVMQAINELPEIEKQLLKERYLDDSSYAELQEKHGLSYKALNMRLLRARQKVKARVEKLLAGVGIFSWQDALEKMLLGGAEAVKIGIKTKLIVTGIAVSIISGGTGIYLWHSHQSEQEMPNPVISQSGQQASILLVNKKSSLSKKQEIRHQVASSLPPKESDKEQEQMATTTEPSVSKILPQVLPITNSEKSKTSSNVANESELTVEMPFGTIKFNPPYWTVEFSPTLDEMRRIDEINKELENPSITEDKRQALLTEKELIIKNAQRPTKYISGTVINQKGDIPDNIDYYRIYEENFPDDRKK
jgi:RNA polymerase sigma factor (sigma-70 family)